MRHGWTRVVGLLTTFCCLAACSDAEPIRSDAAPTTEATASPAAKWFIANGSSAWQPSFEEVAAGAAAFDSPVRNATVVRIFGPRPADSELVDVALALPSPPTEDEGVSLVVLDRSGEWKALPTSASTDRRAFTSKIAAEPIDDSYVVQNSAAPTSTGAIVDLGSGSAELVSAVANDSTPWFERTIGSISYKFSDIVSTRGEPPSCNGAPPEWARDHSYFNDRQAPVRWCAGRDPADPNVLQVKVIANRGYGFAVVPQVRPTWAYTTAWGTGWKDLASQFSSSSIRNIPAGTAAAVGEGYPLPPGEEVHLGFSESAVAGLGSGDPLIRISTKDTYVLMGLIFDWISEKSDELDLKKTAAVIGIIAAQQCGHDVLEAVRTANLPGAGKAFIDCASSFPELAAAAVGVLAGTLKGKDPREIGKTVGKLVGRLFAAWTVATIGSKIGELIDDSRLRDAAWRFDLTPRSPTTAADPMRLLSGERIGNLVIGQDAQNAFDTLTLRHGPPSYDSGWMSGDENRVAHDGQIRTATWTQGWALVVTFRRVGDRSYLADYTVSAARPGYVEPVQLGIGGWYTYNDIQLGSRVTDLRAKFPSVEFVGGEGAWYFSISTGGLRPLVGWLSGESREESSDSGPPGDLQVGGLGSQLDPQAADPDLPLFMSRLVSLPSAAHRAPTSVHRETAGTALERRSDEPGPSAFRT